MKTVGLRTEILFTLTLLLGAALLLGGGMMLRLTEQHLLKEKLTHLDSLSRVLAQSVSAINSDTDSGQVDSALLSHIPLDADCLGWWLYDRALDSRAAFSANGRSPVQMTLLQQVRFAKEAQRIVQFPSMLNLFGTTEASAYFVIPLLEKTRFSGMLVLAYSLEDIRLELLKSLRGVLVYVLLYGTVLVLIGYYLLQRNIITPARHLLLATENVERGNLDTELPLTGPSEISGLAEAFNRMVEALRQSRQETAHHIASLQQTNMELQRVHDELLRSEKLASVGQLAAGLAHEIGNPLSALIGYLEFLKHQIESSSAPDIIDRALAETRRIDLLVRELLDFSRPADCDQIATINLATELRSCITLLENQGNLKTVDITDLLPDDLPLVSINRHKMQQVFINLLLNAVFACRQNGNIVVSGAQDKENVWLSIEDNGCGIPENMLEKIFDPFFTTKQPGEGTGLGLSICHRIIEDAGGRLTVESVIDKGSLFKLFLPRERHICAENA